MKLENLTCNSCGAPLRVPESANYVTCNHCSTQLVVRREDNFTFTQQLDRIEETTEKLSERIDELSSQGEMAALDREWQLEREKYMITDKNGRTHIPTEGGAIAGGIVITVFGSFWTIMACAMSSSAPDVGSFRVVSAVFPLFGVGFVVLGIVMSVIGHSKAGDYKRAQRNYQRRRSELQRRSEN